MANKELAEDRLRALVGDFSGKSLKLPSAPAQPSVPAEEGRGESAPEVREERPQRGPGRPAGSGRSASVRRCCSCKVLEEQYQKLGLMAQMAGCSRQDLMDEAYSRLIASFERENGALDVAGANASGKFKVKF